jgi:hypothetical protein
MARNPADSFPRCSNITRLLTKGTKKSRARRSTKNPEGDESRKAQEIEAVVVWAWGDVLQNREFGSAYEKRETMRLE